MTGASLFEFKFVNIGGVARKTDRQRPGSDFDQLIGHSHYYTTQKA
jgi:hypothetical protein